jgi:hypothetical protein
LEKKEVHQSPSNYIFFFFFVTTVLLFILQSLLTSHILQSHITGHKRTKAQRPPSEEEKANVLISQSPHGTRDTVKRTRGNRK